jgi:RHS repeat-associated protein
VAPDRNHFYCYDGRNRLTIVKTGGCSVTTVMGLGYDVQGNLANKNGQVFTFTMGNRLRYTGTSPASTYVYDGQGRRVRDYTGGSKYSLYSLGGQLAFAQDNRKVTRYWYINLGGSLVAIRERNMSTGAVSVEYHHTDALGSPAVVTASNRVVLERREYEPYGKQLAPAPGDGPGYTGHVYDAATGLNYMQQRYYDPVLGLFVSVDPMPVDMTNGSNFNRYWYANSNPLTLMDPDGRATCADKMCETSTIDPVLPRGNSQPPPVNGTEGLPPMIAVKVDDGFESTVSFQNVDQ